MQLALFGLRPAKIKQITVNCQTDRGPTSWRLDTSDSEDWPIFIRRSGTGIAADLFLEPPPGDCFQKDFTIADQLRRWASRQHPSQGRRAHSSQAGRRPQGTVACRRSDAWVYLTGDEKLFGKLEAIGQETLRLTTPWQDHLDIPLSRVAGIQLGLLEPKETRESFAKRLKTRGSEDLLLAQTKKGEVIAISGIVEQTENGRLHFRYQGKTRTLAARSRSKA